MTCINEYDAQTGEENELYGGSGYLGTDKRLEAKKKNICGKRREHEKSSVRAKVEHVFAVVKLQN